MLTRDDIAKTIAWLNPQRSFEKATRAPSAESR